MDKKELLKKNENAEIISNPIIAGELQKIIDNKLESVIPGLRCILENTC